MEIHNEVINDLLEEARANLRIVAIKDQGPVVKNCTEQPVRTPQDVIQRALNPDLLHEQQQQVKETQKT